MFNVENVSYNAQKNRAKSVKINEYNKTMNDLCKTTVDRYKSKCNIRLTDGNKS